MPRSTETDCRATCDDVGTCDGYVYRTADGMCITLQRVDTDQTLTESPINAATYTYGFKFSSTCVDGWVFYRVL